MRKSFWQVKIVALGKSPTARSLLAQPCSEIKNPTGRTQRGFYSGDVLLSRGLSPHYHRGCSVSLPCSEWERVVPLRYDHQRSEPDCISLLRSDASVEAASLVINYSKNNAGSLISTYRFSESCASTER